MNCKVVIASYLGRGVMMIGAERRRGTEEETNAIIREEDTRIDNKWKWKKQEEKHDEKT